MTQSVGIFAVVRVVVVGSRGCRGRIGRGGHVLTAEFAYTTEPSLILDRWSTQISERIIAVISTASNLCVVPGTYQILNSYGS